MKQAFTLIEVMVTVAIFTLITGVIAAFILTGYKIHGYTFQQSIAIDEARRGIEAMVKEIRESQPGEDGSYIIDKAEDYQFSFYSDIDKNEVIERVRYFIDGTNLKKGITYPSGFPVQYLSATEKITTLSQYVRNQPPIFHYFDGDNVELPSPARLKDTKLMKVRLIINVNPDRPPQDFELESAVQLRNLKTNL
ncbi:MAG: hypothetical protein A2654_01400 [Candidatus Nealsonbacteria bacterium RIFCSPHIGHO2_01_FULL_43_31]|uniref:Type II secretion system protein J n=2 Tax=Candidatus Nealsoniibacteriota TaxID=1817911 RepID=A0A1G2E720_9BACT|nr:MAG: hypothetical protein UV98_C0008G0031 [Parcubacteria group bacterium GW2011_GWB1_43_6]OGZ19584.1 MAG: hypothetical protein A2654_01400 [Candidatus Nealsonbacteria bacterium RIFCSPHIGHO2_01_FULL_43_31]OGZ21636.1 MAG: hypothetical protein A3D46_01250 [Candidatus Nealsonbacteria bacterium RIFCSPHIGHO2_02_FULL_43_13]OGZ24380.1 MAG: hypothetical protein A2922_01740 [Candidatus Nealsonbacteria bacterium RIFCSPLOWO2_01_FULL_43_36]